MPHLQAFTELENAIGTHIHPDALEFFTSFFAGPVESRHSGEVVLLHTIWNHDELQALEGNLIQHAQAQLEDGLTLALPIAVTDSDLFFAVDNATGVVLLQEPGVPGRVVANNLSGFLDAL